MAAVQVGGRYGVIDVHGTFLLPPKFGFLSYCGNGLWSFDEAGFRGLISSDGEVLIPPVYRVIACFVDGIGKAQSRDGNWGFINASGEQLCEFCYDFTGEFSCGLAKVEVGRSNGFVDRNLKIAVGLSRRRWFWPNFHHGMVGFREGKRVGVMDTSGRVVLAAQYTDAAWTSRDLIWVRGERLWGVTNGKGEFVFEPRYSRRRNFTEGLAWVRVGRLWGAINVKGEFAFEPKIASCRFYDDTRKRFLNEAHTNPMPYRCGLARVSVRRQGECRRGFVDKNGEFRFPPVFSHASDFEGGVARVIFPGPKRKCYERANLMNIDGEIIIGPEKGRVVG